MNAFTEKFKEVVPSVVPITLLVLILNFTLTPLEGPLIARFIIGAILIVLGLSVFLVGVDIGVAPLGSLVGSTLAKTNKLWIVIIAGLILGFFISIAEPGLIVLANQVAIVTGGQISSISILMVVSIGMALMLALGFIRILNNTPLHKLLTGLYGITFLLAILSSSEFLAISFDASGATTGVLAVPFILALALGVSNLKKNSKAAEEDSFGLVAITSVGAIIAVLVMSLISGAEEFPGGLEIGYDNTISVIGPFIDIIPEIFQESVISILPLLVIFLVLQKIAFKLGRHSFHRIVKGFIYTFIGLLIFLVGVNAGFMDVGSMIGYTLAQFDNKVYLIVIGLILGVVTILAEPAVYVLTHQIEEVTSGYVKRRVVLIALSTGVGLAIGLSMLRIVILEIQLWHYLLPGYILSIGMSYFVPKLFVGIAFDAGGVATGPMTATFILAFTQGAAESVEWADVLIDGFGMIAAVALMPIITLQIVGFIFAMKTKKGGLFEDGE